MTELTIDEVREYLKLRQGREITVDAVRKDFNLQPGTNSYKNVNTIMYRLSDQKVVSPVGKRDGIWKVIVPVVPVSVFSKPRDIIPPLELNFPVDQETGMELSFAEDVVIRGGDLILISGVSNFGKTTLCMNFLAENLNLSPVLMGNEYTTTEGEPAPRFLSRLEAMEWVDWADVDGEDRFTLLPVRDDHAEHIVKDRINIIDWINIETGEHYLIGTILGNIKRAVGKSGIAIVAIQKGEGKDAGRGGQFTKDFADLELLIDKLGEDEVKLTVGKVKESNKPVVGRMFGYSILKGVKIVNFREIMKCSSCWGKGFTMRGQCDNCHGKGYINK